MISSTVSIALTEKRNLSAVAVSEVVRRPSATAVDEPSRNLAARGSFLRIPPFPGAEIEHFAGAEPLSVDAGVLADRLRQLRVGGTYWAAQPPLPDRYVLATSAAAVHAAKDIAPDAPLVLWALKGREVAPEGIRIVAGECDPWHMLAGATAIVGEIDEDLRLIAALLEVDCHVLDPEGKSTHALSLDRIALVAEAFACGEFENPFDGEPMDALEAVELCGFWRSLIDSNRTITAGFGFAFWKQESVAPLLWNGAPPRFLRNASAVESRETVAVWRARTSAEALSDLERSGVRLVEVEDGFLRSSGLGADCVPPLSITVDERGAHFDPGCPSDLEVLLRDAEMDEELIQRARELRRLVVQAGLGKYGAGTEAAHRRVDGRRHILVPGQVEDDRAVQTGGCGLASNLELLKRVRQQAPDAYIIYKPHPDVVAGHRRGHVPDRACLEQADEVAEDAPIAPLLAMVDEVHVNTSLAGFEALLREKSVTTYGVPFYAGWGLTRDLGPVPARRTARRSLDELVAATLLLYPRYLDPVTGLPCPAEVLVSRLSASQSRRSGMIVGMRRLQGRFLRRLRSWVQ